MNDIRRTILWVIFGFSMVLLWDQWQIHNGQKATFFPAPVAVNKEAASAPVSGASNAGVPTPAAVATAKPSIASTAHSLVPPTAAVVPITIGSAPVLASSVALTATLAFDAPTGPADPYTYKVQVTTNDGSTWGSLITPSNVAVSGGTVTLTFTAAAGAQKARAVATGTNGASANSAKSNSVTVAAS